MAKVRASHWFDPEPPSRPTVSNKIAESPLLAPLLLSNDSPTASQYAAAQEFFESHNARMSKIRVERSHIEFGLLAMPEFAALKATRQVLIDAEHVVRAEICLLRGIMSPIRRVPPELVREIFLFLTPSLDVEYSPHDPSSILKVPTPWDLGHICRSWREITLSLGLLWSVFDIDVASDMDSNHLPRAIAYRLQRSANAPISIRFRGTAYDLTQGCIELVNMFAKHVHHFKRLDLHKACDVLRQLSTKTDPLRGLGPTASKTSFLCLSDLTLHYINLPMHPQRRWGNFPDPRTGIKTRKWLNTGLTRLLGHHFTPTIAIHPPASLTASTLEPNARGLTLPRVSITWRDFQSTQKLQADFPVFPELPGPLHDPAALFFSQNHDPHLSLPESVGEFSIAKALDGANSPQNSINDPRAPTRA
ncbi:hypothetical protein C8F04DRAFT_1253036 [Mycena alexandri]|uniref:F-box domain-containing protein n=1 Tax=Mycena alexandri TaxID=1745969 RepID=A0AAD6TCC3_9AGAR|nr:hypothetical protein C8F04DRAFT_1253035 [Mycena alexandri]KAJ7041338.1 hypothetical protein C8F04DRAFT_1253036 [Mycena alexandri]